MDDVSIFEVLRPMGETSMAPTEFVEVVMTSTSVRSAIARNAPITNFGFSNSFCLSEFEECDHQ